MPQYLASNLTLDFSTLFRGCSPKARRESVGAEAGTMGKVRIVDIEIPSHDVHATYQHGGSAE